MLRSLPIKKSKKRNSIEFLEQLRENGNEINQMHFFDADSGVESGDETSKELPEIEEVCNGQ
jgi:hypothetical protein